MKKNNSFAHYLENLDISFKVKKTYFETTATIIANQKKRKT